MKSGAMFGTLPKYKDQEYYDKHPVMYLLTPDITYKVELIAGYITPSDSELTHCLRRRRARALFSNMPYRNPPLHPL